MSRSYRTVRRVIFCLIAILLMLSGFLVMTQPQLIGYLIPIGGYSDIYAGFAQAAVVNARNNQVNILVLPLAYSSSPAVITDTERTANLRDAEERRFQIEEACKRAAPQNMTCQATLAPIFPRSEAVDSAAPNFFAEDLSAPFLLGGDQAMTMRLLSGMPLEIVLTKAYGSGFVIANGLLDVFVSGDAVASSTADLRAVPARAPTSTATPTPTLTPPAPSSATATSIPTAASFGTSATGEVPPVMPITIGAAVLLFVIVLVAGRRRK